MNFTQKIRTLAIGLALVAPIAAMPAAQAQIGIGIGISVHIAPPILPVYVQPPLPAPGYLWTPGYWGYGDAGYYWVPGVWVQPPSVGVLWTPGYWGYAGGLYGWHAGYWGPHIGFYGGVNYGFGYGGLGYEGGYWNHGALFYNHSINNFGGVHVTNVYEHNVTVINRTNVSFNGEGGVQARASANEMAAANEHHFEPTANQQEHFQAAAHDRGQLASVNGGHPATMAAASPAAYHQVAQQHERTQPISAQDRAQGKAFQPNGRAANQDQRIANGLKTGQMTSGEAARADRTQSAIDTQVHNDRAANGGKLTGQERQQINGEQNAASRQIYNEKHNGNTVAPNAVDNREANQQQRTANGLRTGQETAGEAGRTNARQAGVDQQVHNDRVANGGALNQQQKQQVNREQNQNSRQINQQKHNENTHPAPPAHEGGGEKKH